MTFKCLQIILFDGFMKAELQYIKNFTLKKSPVHILWACLCAHVIFRPKHPLKVHVWAGISLRGATQICIFDGIMDAPLYIEILRFTLLPFIAEKYPEGHRFMQDR